jgi:eukaryotic-like serine/threonine-protein kinase
MKRESWDTVSHWVNSWLAADADEREQLRVRLAAEQPDLAAEIDALTAVSDELPGFLETPALVLAASDLAHEDDRLAEGSMLGPYCVDRFVARGGMGDVYRAVDTRLQRPVAIKVLAPTKTGDPHRVARFMHEARVTASLDHPNIVKVYDVGRFEDRAYLVAEFLEGETLRARIARGPMPAADVTRIAIEIARGLQAAHSAALVHRDLKPDNVFLTAGATTKILDFGIAKLAQDETVREGFSTLTGVVIGTAGYLAPEQIRGEGIDARADLFALGALMFEMLTAVRVFARQHTVDTLHAILHERPSDTLMERFDGPPALAAIVMRLLEKSPEARFQSSAAVIEALERVDVGDRATAARLWVRRAIRHARAVGSSRRARWAALAVAGVAAAIAASVWPELPGPAPANGDSPALVLAVMPFRSLPAGGDSELLEIGLADVVVSRLGQLANVRVLPLTATERLKGREPRDVGRALGATHVLTVSLQRDQRAVRAVPLLSAVSDGRIVWSTNVDTDAASVFSIQDIIVTRVVEELAPRLSPNARTTLARAGTRSGDAFDAYLRGRVHVLRPTAPDLTRAAALFEQALKIDPNYADAWAGLGSAYKRLPIVTGGSSDAFAKARDAARRALEIDPQHAEAHSVLGTIAFWYEWDYPRAEALLRRALELQPSSADSQVFLAHLFSNIGRSDEALAEIRRARALDPAWPVPRSLEGQFLFMARRYDDALRHLDDMLKVHPDFWNAQLFRVWALIGLGRYEESLAASDRAHVLHPRPEGSAMGPLAMKGYALARLGRRAEAEAVLDAIRNEQSNPAILLHALGRDQEALDRLRRALDERSVSVTFSRRRSEMGRHAPRTRVQGDPVPCEPARDLGSHSTLNADCEPVPHAAQRAFSATRVAIRSATLPTASLKSWPPPRLVKAATAISREG